MYCKDKCTECDGKCKLPSNHGHNLSRWKHVCDKNKNHQWPVKFLTSWKE